MDPTAPDPKDEPQGPAEPAAPAEPVQIAEPLVQPSDIGDLQIRSSEPPPRPDGKGREPEERG